MQGFAVALHLRRLVDFYYCVYGAFFYAGGASGAFVVVDGSVEVCYGNGFGLTVFFAELAAYAAVLAVEFGLLSVVFG